MNKKRILFIDGPLGGGGAERVLIDILRNFDYKKYEVDLAVICRGGVLMDEVPPQVNVIELWNGYSLSYKLAYRLSKWFRCNWLLSKKMNGKKLRRDYDLEISFLEGMPTKLGAIRNTKSRKAAWVHADLYTQRYEAAQFYHGEELKAYNSMDYIINVSKFCETKFKQRFPNYKSNLKVIYNPIDQSKILQMSRKNLVATNSNKKSFIVISVGRLVEAKNPKRFLEVARLAKDAGLDIQFRWIGDGTLRREMELLRDEWNLNNTVEFTGFLKNPFPEIKDADVLLVTSDYEGFCLVICEAMCLEIPVISTRTAGPSEIIGENEYGLLTDLNAESVYQALKYWYDNLDERKAMACKAKNRPDNYSVEETISQIYSLM